MVGVNVILSDLDQKIIAQCSLQNFLSIIGIQLTYF